MGAMVVLVQHGDFTKIMGGTNFFHSHDKDDRYQSICVICNPGRVCKVVGNDLVPLTPTEEYWHNKYVAQREMENITPWKYCPWCGKILLVAPNAHICGEPDID